MAADFSDTASFDAVFFVPRPSPPAEPKPSPLCRHHRPLRRTYRRCPAAPHCPKFAHNRHCSRVAVPLGRKSGRCGRVEGKRIPNTPVTTFDTARHASPVVAEAKPSDFLGNLVRPARIERATICLEGRCSIQLSYGRNPINTGVLSPGQLCPLPR